MTDVLDQVTSEGIDMKSEIIIERYAEPLEGKRAQLHQAVFVDGEQVPELSYPCGSPAPVVTVREHEEVIRFS